MIHSCCSTAVVPPSGCVAMAVIQHNKEWYCERLGSMYVAAGFVEHYYSGITTSVKGICWAPSL